MSMREPEEAKDGMELYEQKIEDGGMMDQAAA